MAGNGVLQTAGRAVSKVFVSAVQTGNGSAQTIAHGLKKTPALFFVVPQTGVTSIASVSADETNVYATVTNTGTYLVVAFESA